MTSQDRVSITVRLPADLAARVAAEEDRLMVGRSRMVEVALENLLGHTASLPDMAPVAALRTEPPPLKIEADPAWLDSEFSGTAWGLIPRLGRILGRKRR